MKKIPAKKTETSKTRAKVRPVASKPTVKQSKPKPCGGSWSVSIYVYWFIILFFIAATFYILGRAHNGQPKLDGANIEITEEVLKQSADYYESGKAKLLEGNLGDAIVDLTAAIDAGAPTVDTYILRGEAHMQSGDWRAAMADFNAALAKDPANAVAYYDRALLNSRLEDYNAAMNDINNALAASASKPTPVLQLRDLYAKRGQLNLWMKNWQGAIADYTNSLARPEGKVDPNVYAERAEAYIALGSLPEAINDYSSAVRIISEQIQGTTEMAERETLSSRAMTFFEKSAGLNLNIGNIEGARTDLESSYTIAVALKDDESAQRLQGLIAELNQPVPVEDTPVVTEPAPAEAPVVEPAPEAPVVEPAPEAPVVE